MASIINMWRLRHGQVKKSTSMGRVKEDCLNFLTQKSEGYQYLLGRGITWLNRDSINVSSFRKSEINLNCGISMLCAPVRLLQTASNQSATNIALYNKGAIASYNKFRSYKNYRQHLPPHPQENFPFSHWAELPHIGLLLQKHMEGAYQTAQIERTRREGEKWGR